MSRLTGWLVCNLCRQVKGKMLREAKDAEKLVRDGVKGGDERESFR